MSGNSGAGSKDDSSSSRQEAKATSGEGSRQQAEQEASGQLDRMEAAIAQLGERLNNRLGKMDSRLNQMDNRLGQMDKKLGHAIEAAWRSTIVAQEGMVASQPMLINSIDRLADFIGTSLLKDLTQRTDLAHALAKHLIEDKTADKMLGRMAQDILSIDSHSSSAMLRHMRNAYSQHSFGAPNMQPTDKAHAIGKFIGELNRHPYDHHKALMRTLLRIKDLFELPTQESQVAALLGTQGAGMCMAVFAAQQLLTSQCDQAKGAGRSAHAHEAVAAISAAGLCSQQPVHKFNNIYVGQHAVEMDVRGNIMMRDGSAMVWVGEIKSSVKQFGAGLQQLALRLALFEWALRTARPDLLSVTKTGKLYLPQYEAESVAPLYEVVPTGHLFMVVGI
eukprot:CAMPEP_0202860912 /NCGR_PEP_ID=MMETSP1391-20130828/2480_1 /ASSEMBLY_ACC=CAM_ASM_000867 /TAXON_ID=1034604 /ORGANISM="Chlamydomonas leiostraca, Strain SAG 11-49" /LENGTH=390 /DNA_ID=CAMNT_0049540199 /DNA_START=196 /DNA_END=1368 /DNA_ORIENTATION=-